jgi:hypothetical protein
MNPGGISMVELVKQIDTDLKYEGHEIKDDTLFLHVVSARDEAVCPYCGMASGRVHSKYERRFADLPIQGMKVIVVLRNRKMFCGNPECGYKTFAETFACLPFKGKRSLRLTDKILRLSLEVSSVTASKILRKGIADVGKSTICDLIKKNQAQY